MFLNKGTSEVNISPKCEFPHFLETFGRVSGTKSPQNVNSLTFWEFSVAFQEQNLSKCQKVRSGAQPASGGSGWRAGRPADLVK